MLCTLFPARLQWKFPRPKHRGWRQAFRTPWPGVPLRRLLWVTAHSRRLSGLPPTRTNLEKSFHALLQLSQSEFEAEEVLTMIGWDL